MPISGSAQRRRQSRTASASILPRRIADRWPDFAAARAWYERPEGLRVAAGDWHRRYGYALQQARVTSQPAGAGSLPA